MAIENHKTYRDYLDKLGEAADVAIGSYGDLLDALQKRHDFFASIGCRLSDHGMDTFYHCDGFTELDIEYIFNKAIMGGTLDSDELEAFRGAFLHDMAVMDAEAGWAQQYHVGAIRNNNEKMFKLLGPDTGFDAIHDLPLAAAGHRFFSRLAAEDKLAKTILYCLNPKDNELLAVMAYTFNDGTFPGKMQLGSAWWFLDQEDGMRKQLNALSALGLLSRFVGMLTDSRSFISYPRHEYFRRILCDVLGRDLADGKLPKSEMPFIHQMVKDISYNNAKYYFGF
jgi:glucuronate isomerase